MLQCRPDRDEFSRRKKDGKKAAKRKLEAKDKTARKEKSISLSKSLVFDCIRPETGEGEIKIILL